MLERSEQHQEGEFSLRNEDGFLKPSADLAWILGILSTGGYARPGMRMVSMQSNNSYLLEGFRNVGEKVFRINASNIVRRDTEGVRTIIGVYFYGPELASALGDLRRPIWTRTVIEKHDWIFTNPRYIWSFLEGVFERAGYIANPSSGRARIYFYSDFINVASFSSDLLTWVGIENPTFRHKNNKAQGIDGVNISSLKDIKLIVENIHSLSPDKESRLAYYRKLPLQEHSKVSRSHFSTEELIQEWIRITRLIGHFPSSYELQQLRDQNSTKFSPLVYMRRFGGGTFVSARANLEKISRDYLDSNARPLSIALKAQVDQDRINAEDVERNYIEPGVDTQSELSLVSQKPAEHILYGSDGKSIILRVTESKSRSSLWLKD